MKVLIAMDKFKGSMSAAEAAAAIAGALAEKGDGAESLDISLSSIADGGEGTTDILVAALGGERVVCRTRDALGGAVDAVFGWVADQKLAVIEMASASGLDLLLKRDRELDPWKASTVGTGEMIIEAKERGARKIIVGIGGSATNDGGSGMAQALGFQFIDASGKRVEKVPEMLDQLAEIKAPDLSLPDITVACDVTNPLLGDKGCTRVYGAQKGIADLAMAKHEARLERLADVVERAMGRDYRSIPGAGAAGGLGFGLMAFGGARLEPGFDLIASVTGLEEKVRGVDLVITGEGSLDAQSLNGKGPVGVAEMARSHGKPVVAFAGRVSEPALFEGVFDAVITLASSEAEAEDSIRQGAKFLARAAERSRDLLLQFGMK